MKKAVIFILLITTFCLSFISSIRRSFADDAAIYYFTDNMSDANSFKNYLINTSNYSSSDIVIVDWTNGFVEKMRLFNDQMNYQNYESSYLIFELTSGLKHPDNESEKQRNISFFNAMENSFSELKDNNNQIAFICGYDETLFLDENDFLYYVDIHINKDILTVFLYNVFYNIETFFGNDLINDCTILFDYALLNEVFGFDFISFYKKYIGPYFDDYIINTSYSNVVDYFYRETIDVYFGADYLMNYNKITNITNNMTYYTSSSLSNILLDSNVFIVGASSFYEISYSGINYYSEFLSYVSDNINPNVFYVYDRYNLTIESGYYLILNPNTSISIEEMLYDFVSDNDLSPYDNWSGLCEITHKMINVSDNSSWLYDLYAACEYYWGFLSLVMYD